MKLFLIAVSTALLWSQAESSYFGVAQGTPLGGFSQHRSFHGGFIPGGLYDNGAPVVNHGLSAGYLQGPIYSNGGYLDYAYGSGKYFGSPYGNGGLLKYLYGNRLGLGNQYSGLGNVRTSGINDNRDDGSSTSGSESVLSGTDDAGLVSGRPNLGSIQNGVFGLPSSPVAAFGLPSAVGPYTSIPGLSGFPYGVHPHTSTLGTYPYGLGSLSSISGLGGFSYGAGAHASVAGLGGFPYDITHDASVAALSQQYGFLPNVGAHIPVGAVAGFPYGPELGTSFGGLGGFHSGLGPYAPVAGLGGLYATGPHLGRYSPGRGLHTPSAALKTHHTGFGSRHSSNVSSENKDTNDKKGAKN